jgi:hypothetical protein
VLSGFSGKLAERWAAQGVAGAAVFWLGGFGIWLWSSPAPVGSIQGWGDAVAARLAPLQGLPSVAKASVAALALAGLVVSGVAAERLTLPVLRLLQGHWLDRWPWFLYRTRLDGIWARRQRMRRRWEELARTRTRWDGQQHAEFVRLDQRLHWMPGRKELLQPTRLGNILRAAESGPPSRYGLEVSACWPALWLLLPPETRTEIAHAREALNRTARAWLWAVVFSVWAPWAWWAAPLGVAAAMVIYAAALLPAARAYGSLVHAVFDVHRGLLYQALRHPQPTTPAEELQSGTALTLALWRGSDRPAPRLISVEVPDHTAEESVG